MPNLGIDTVTKSLRQLTNAIDIDILFIEGLLHNP
jgi:hypothetical protein